MAETGKQSCPVVGFGVTSVGYLGCATRMLIIYDNASNISRQQQLQHVGDNILTD
jgi:hypothetical protein